MNRTILMLLASALLVSCGQGNRKNPGEARPVTVREFLDDPGPYLDQTVQVSGTVVHVCRYGGQRLFIVGEEGNERVRITTGENISEFDVSLEGEKLDVTGIVRELIIDETYLAQWEAQVLESSTAGHGGGVETHIGHGDSHGTETAVPAEGAGTPDVTETDKENQLARIQKVRDEIAESGKDHLSDFWIETLSFTVIKE